MLLLTALHVMANLVWIGSLASVGVLLATASSLADKARAATLAEASAQLYRKVATPAFGVSFLAGLTQFGMNLGYYAKAHWFHGKLTFALVAIALHHVVGAKSKRAASGEVQGGKSSAILTVAFLASAFVTVLLAVEKTELVP
jgi:uncharacterized membrane protein